jgi:hypothetical protein
VVQLNKPTSTGGDDPKEIHYHKDVVQRIVQKNHSNPKVPIQPNLTLTLTLTLTQK